MVNGYNFSELVDSFEEVTIGVTEVKSDLSTYSLAESIVNYSKALKLYQIALDDFTSENPVFINNEYKNSEAAQFQVVKSFLISALPILESKSKAIKSYYKNLDSLVLEAATGLNVSPENYSLSNHESLESQLENELNLTEDEFNEFKSFVFPDFRISGNNKNSSSKLEMAVETLESYYNDYAQKARNAKNYSLEQIQDAKNKFLNKAKQTRNLIKNYGPSALQKYDEFLSPLDSRFQYLPMWKFSSDLRKYLVECAVGVNPQGGAGVTPNGLPYYYKKKIGKQMQKRGWTTPLLHSVLDSPTHKYPTRDERNRPDGTRENDPATVYLNKNNEYVVRNDVSGEIIQVSNRNDPNWQPPPQP